MCNNFKMVSKGRGNLLNEKHYKEYRDGKNQKTKKRKKERE